MPSDVFTLNAIVCELDDMLSGGRIDRITQPEKDEVFLHIRAKGVTRCLVISVNPNAPRMHLTDTKKDNPYAAPAFLMHLRRHVQGGQITHIEIVNYDRIVCISIQSRTEMYDTVSMRLYVELMGRYSNLIAVDADGYITDAMRHIPPAEDQLRAVLPHLRYSLPPRGKIPPTDVEAVRQALCAFAGGDLAKYLFENVAGMVNVTARQLLYDVGLPTACVQIGDRQALALAQHVAQAYNCYSTPLFAPCYAQADNGELMDYYAFAYHTSPYRLHQTATLNEAVNFCADAKDKALRLKNNAKHIASVVQTAIKKHEKALAIARQKIADCADCEQLRIVGELITNNIYRLQKGMTSAQLYDYYNDCEIQVALDIARTPAENAQAYFKKYAKQKRTVAVATEQVQQYTAMLDYLHSVQTALSLAEDSKELAEIEAELVQNGLIAPPKTAKKVRKPEAQPLQRFDIKGFTVLRGKNNLQNEQLTFHTAKESDVWLHVKAAHGSHVVIVTEGRPAPDDVLQTAAEIAAYYSDLRQSDKAAVDYAPRRNVKHHPSRKTGMVLYTEYQTMQVAPKGHSEYETKQ